MKIVVLGLALLPMAAFAHGFESGDLKVGHPWTRATPAGAGMAAGYLSLENIGQAADSLVGAEVNGHEAMIHTTKVENGVAEMVHVDTVDVAPGQKVVMQPGGLHLMWEQATPLEEGAMVKGRLVFRTAPAVDVEFKVEAAGARAAEHMH